MDHIRILPLSPSQTFQHLFQLKPDLRMLVWLAGFDDQGIWTAAKSKSALTKYPIQKKKHNTTPSNKKSQPSSQSSTCSKPTSQKRNTSRQGPSSQSQPAHRISRQFTLNLAHSIPGNPDRMFTAFFVPYDGHCLFKSFKDALQIDTSIHDLRAQVVRTISEETDPAIRISALNTHISREQEHRNPDWQHIQLLDAGTVSEPGSLDIQFSVLWLKYADHMSVDAWAGTFKS